MTPDPDALDWIVSDLPASAPRPEHLRAARLAARMTVVAAAHWCAMSARGWQRMERGETRVQVASYRLMLILAGALPWIGWRGWLMSDGHLFEPGSTRRGLAPGQIMTMMWTHDRLSLAREDLARVTHERDALAAILARTPARRSRRRGSPGSRVKLAL